MGSGAPTPSAMVISLRGSGDAAAVTQREERRRITANLPTNTVDCRGFDSSIILNLRGGILRCIGDFPESLSQAMLVGTMLVGRLGVVRTTSSGGWTYSQQRVDGCGAGFEIDGCPIHTCHRIRVAVDGSHTFVWQRPHPYLLVTDYTWSRHTCGKINMFVTTFANDFEMYDPTWNQIASLRCCNLRLIGCLRGWRNTVGSLIEIVWLKKTVHGPQCTGICVNHIGVFNSTISTVLFQLHSANPSLLIGLCCTPGRSSPGQNSTMNSV